MSATSSDALHAAVLVTCATIASCDDLAGFRLGDMREAGLYNTVEAPVR
jgi:hypothetical protein